MLRRRGPDRSRGWSAAAGRVLGAGAVLILVAIAGVALLLPPPAEADRMRASRPMPGDDSTAVPAPGPPPGSSAPLTPGAFGLEWWAPWSGGARLSAPGSSADSRCGQAGLQGKVNLNVAGVEELDLLPGIGPTKAQRIVDWRFRHGPFRRIKDLRRVKGFGRKTVLKLAPHLTLDQPIIDGNAGPRSTSWP